MEQLTLKRHSSDGDWQEPICFDGEWTSPGTPGFLLDSVWSKTSWPTSPSSSDYSLKRVKYADDEDHQAQTGLPIPTAMRNILPSFFPKLPSKTVHPTFRVVHNPFAEVAEMRHRSLRKEKILTDIHGCVNGYVKFKVIQHGQRARQPSFPSNHPSSSNSFPRSKTRLVPSTSLESSSKTSEAQHLPRQYRPPMIPANFGRMQKFDDTDAKLFKFYVVAICAGRTLLPKTNGWKEALAPIAESDPCVAHALLALSSGYVLDFNSNDAIKNRCNFHYRMASELLTKKIADPRYRAIGRDDTDALIAAFRILWCDDIVQWELRSDKDCNPRWWRGIKEAKVIMAETDPGYRYYNHENVQCSTARVSNANMIAYVEILSLVVFPLDPKETEICHPWLLQDSARNIRRIYGGTGLSPKLLHILGQITHLCARFAKHDERSEMLPLGAEMIDSKLNNFRQWSELSEGYSTTQELLDSVVLDVDGLVNTDVKVTELSGEAWVQACRLYLHCRFFRSVRQNDIYQAYENSLPRTHVLVQQILALLRQCVEPLPTYGPLFTSQSPLFPIFIMGIVSTSDSDRNVARHWFESVESRSGPRSSIPPLWRTLQKIWNWMDNELMDESCEEVDSKPIGERNPWWETMVEKIVESYGRITIV